MITGMLKDVMEVIAVLMVLLGTVIIIGAELYFKERK